MMTTTLSQKIRPNALAAFGGCKDMAENLQKLLSALGSDGAERTVQRHIFSERERYTAKKEVDAALLASPVIEAATISIKASCDGPAPDYVQGYLSLLRKDLSHLISLAGEFCQHYETFKQDTARLDDFLVRFAAAADIDNAHAMYLSSDNWSWSVFKSLLEALVDKYQDKRVFYSILKGGIIDIRTYIHLVADHYKYGGQMQEHIAHYSERQHLINEHFWSPLMLFPFKNTGLAVDLGKLSLQQPSNCELVDAYTDLYHTRYLYDSLEYFGFYGFVRCAIADLCSQLAIRTKMERYQKAADYITLYQFHFCSELYRHSNF